MKVAVGPKEPDDFLVEALGLSVGLGMVPGRKAHVNLEHISEHLIDKRLEDGWTICQAERHNQIFIVPRAGGKGGFSLVPLADADQVIGTPQIQFSVESGCAQEFQGSGH